MVKKSKARSVVVCLICAVLVAYAFTSGWWHEVNHVSIVSMDGRPSVTNRVLPQTNVDLVSYSAYNSLGDIQNKIPRALD